jgi:hypothetical protein
MSDELVDVADADRWGKNKCVSVSRFLRPIKSLEPPYALEGNAEDVPGHQSERNTNLSNHRSNATSLGKVNRSVRVMAVFDVMRRKRELFSDHDTLRSVMICRKGEYSDSAALKRRVWKGSIQAAVIRSYDLEELSLNSAVIDADDVEITAWDVEHFHNKP